MRKLPALRRSETVQESTGQPTDETRKTSSRLREVAISVLIVGILATAILSAVPGSMIKGAVAPVLYPVARFTGLDQSWGMFAPNPPKTNSAIEVHVVMSNGADRVWNPFDDPSLRKMQWRKFKEDVINSPEYRPGLALWAVRQMTKDTDEKAVRVVIIAQSETLPFPGRGDSKTTKKLLLDQRVPAALSKGQRP
jgi:hypothetical protein